MIKQGDCLVLNEQEAHCIARHLQALLYGRGLSDACNFCKTQCYQGDRAPSFDEIKEHLTEETGVDLGYTKSEFYGSNFDYRRFLKNTNEETRDYFKKYFAEI